MKSINNDDNNNSNSLLGFSLSPCMNMEVSSDSTHHYQLSQAPSASAAHFNYGICNYGTEGDSSGLLSSLPMMPLKSDGSLCMMESLSRSQPQVINSTTPKLEDFFGGATVETHQYDSNGSREGRSLELDSMFYSQNPGYAQQNNRAQQIQAHYYQYYSALRNYDMLQGLQGKEIQHANCNLQLQTMADNVLDATKSCYSRGYPYALEHNMSRSMNGSVVCETSNAVACGDLQSLSLSMSPGSQSSCITVSQQISPTLTGYAAMEGNKRALDKVDHKQIVHRKSIDTFGQRTSQYRGVTRHRWTGRYEAHLWDNSCKREGQNRKGRQVYLGGYDMEEKAAKAYDLAALKYWGPSTHINFPLENYQKELEEMEHMTRQEFVAHLRRKSSGFSRGASMYRGVTRHHQHGRWQARIGRVAGNKDLYLGTFSTQEEAAEAYDIAAIKFRGTNAVTNFDISKYDVEKIIASNTLLSGELARRNKDVEPINMTINQSSPTTYNNNADVKAFAQENAINEAKPDWKMALFQSSQQLGHTQNIANVKSQSFSMALDNAIGSKAIGSTQKEAEDPIQMGTHLSNPSSLVTSLGSSREGSPDKANQTMIFQMPTPGSKLLANASSNADSWIPRPTMSLPHMPVFATWMDN